MGFPPSADPLTDVERVLVVVAHPDDVDYGAAGTIATWTDAGITVSYCIATRGDAGGFDDTARHEMPLLREAEQRAAAAAVGVTDVTFLDYPDGAVYVSHDLRRDLTREIRRLRPDRLLTQSPEPNWAQIGPTHPDHAYVAQAAFWAVYPDARNRFAHPELLRDEGLEPWTVREVWFFDTLEADYAVDITGTADRKFAALRAHASQTAHLTELESQLRAGFSANAERNGLGPGRLAELFSIVRTE